MQATMQDTQHQTYFLLFRHQHCKDSKQEWTRRTVWVLLSRPASRGGDAADTHAAQCMPNGQMGKRQSEDPATSHSHACKGDMRRGSVVSWELRYQFLS